MEGKLKDAEKDERTDGQKREGVGERRKEGEEKRKTGLLSVIKHSDQKQLEEEGLIWLPCPDHSPL